MSDFLTLTPRYGRGYKTCAEVEQAFNEGKDFTVSDISSPWNGNAANKADLLMGGVEIARIRYRKLTQVVNIEVKP